MTGSFDPLDWVPIADGLEVTADALKIDGVRVTATAWEASKIALALGAVLWTPAVSDLAYVRAEVKPLPVTLPNCPTDDASRRLHSRRIDEQLVTWEKAHGRSAAGLLVAPTGKQWMAPKRDIRKGHAAEYGWQVSADLVRRDKGATTWRGIPVYRAAQHFVIQPEWTWHDAGTEKGGGHSDYSRFLRFMRGHNTALYLRDRFETYLEAA